MRVRHRIRKKSPLIEFRRHDKLARNATEGLKRQQQPKFNIR